MSLEKIILKWILWTLTFTLIIGGTPWHFPAQGRYWLESVLEKNSKREVERKDSFLERPLQMPQSPKQ
jgi:hypothetical protein